jgi:hypothetical protein
MELVPERAWSDLTGMSMGQCFEHRLQPLFPVLPEVKRTLSGAYRPSSP